MSPEEAQKLAASTMSNILSQEEIAHAFIGGFAVQLLGHNRQTDDIDVEVDAANANDLRGRIRDTLITLDERFSVEGMKLYFTPVQNPEARVLVETIPIGEFGLPLSLEVIRPGDGTIPILRPGVLILTKIKRCAQYIGSSRPRSIAKFESDVSDIVYLLHWLVENGQKIDFIGYQTLSTDRLYQATEALVTYWKEDHSADYVDLMSLVLEDKDREKVFVH